MSNKRQMEFMPSVSRSSGLDKDGDSLKNFEVQETYRAFIEEKLERVLQRSENIGSETEDAKKHRIEEQENVLILFRKLREGISSSNRTDSFSVEVYERSLYLSLIFTSPKHTTAIIPALLNDLYPKAFTPVKKDPDPHRAHHRHISFLVSLLHHLITAYPSQSLYHQQRTSPSSWAPPQTTSAWLKSLTCSLRTGNYHQFTILTQHERILQLITPTDSQRSVHDDLAKRALLTAVEALRAKVRETVWGIVRSAYRELWFDEPAYDTRSWLGRSLCLDTSSMDMDGWLDHVGSAGHVRKKEDSDTRWIVTKVR
ncbi:hypothetical protein P691DRAFT_755972 [Macrolepiota fuliginosa MF-IS2]|uniref:Uncharacterized protein n=1 Tax=Macrolepiota fuliginosa MF-IS2 TaxID=1400762 RepID=A0A9P5XLI1_9AGAR|nr:hypothetical protein P691DRAFT_755972 [Macrolepiota fuliginosa MF-IS2]